MCLVFSVEKLPYYAAHNSGNDYRNLVHNHFSKSVVENVTNIRLKIE